MSVDLKQQQRIEASRNYAMLHRKPNVAAAVSPEALVHAVKRMEGIGIFA